MNIYIHPLFDMLVFVDHKINKMYFLSNNKIVEVRIVEDYVEDRLIPV